MEPDTKSAVETAGGRDNPCGAFTRGGWCYRDVAALLNVVKSRSVLSVMVSMIGRVTRGFCNRGCAVVVGSPDGVDRLIVADVLCMRAVVNMIVSMLMTRI